MSTIIQKIRHLNHYPIIQRCTVDDNVQVCNETLAKIALITREGPLASRYVAVTLFERLAKKSSSLSAKIIPILLYALRHGSLDFKEEVRYKKDLITKLMQSALKCQGTLVHGLYKELVELIEYEHRKSLLADSYDSDFYQPRCLSSEDVKSRGGITRDIQIDEIISPEKRAVDQITAPSCIEILPSMMEIWRFSGQYKELNQHVVNAELLNVLHATNTPAQLRALSVLDYLSQHFKGSQMSGFSERLEQLSKSENNDISKPARKILNRVLRGAPDTENNNATTPPPVSPQLKCQTQDNLYSSHMKRSYDKILLTATPTSGYKPLSYSEQVRGDDALLDLGSPCSSNSLNNTPPPSHRASFLSFFSTTPTIPRSRRSSVNSTDNLLDDQNLTSSENL